ncbi:MAG: T9SS type A sorting domain-containing protein [Rhodothermia bacterium]|nr:T9SS type A sorting domain-containing protein [Rhodothermia bacterium]
MAPPRFNETIILAVILALTTGVAAAQSQQKVMAADGSQNDFFGMSVSLRGELAVVGTSATSGAAYVIRPQCHAGPCQWQEEQKLTSGMFGDRFGFAVAGSGRRVVVGAPEDSNEKGVGAGSAYLFAYDGEQWSLEQTITASDGEAYDAFGHSVAMDGNLMVVGSPMGDTGGMNPMMSGSAYVFRHDGTGWIEEQELVPHDPAMADRFANSVAIQGSRIVVGAPRNDNGLGMNAGAIYIFRRSDCPTSETCTWVLEQKVLASDGAASDFFGSSVAIDGNRIVGGAWKGDHAPGMESGAAYAFRHDGTQWNEEQKLVADDAESGDQFGGQVTVSGSRIVIAANADSNDNGERSGSAYSFRFDGENWVQENKLMAGDGAPNDRFPLSVSLDGDRAIMGMPFDENDNGILAGSAYVFEFARTVDVKPNEAVRSTYRLDQNRPNPATLSTIVSFELPTASEVHLTLIDVLGRRVKEVMSDRMGPGVHEKQVDVSHLPAGVYYYRLEADDYAETKRMVVIK